MMQNGKGTVTPFLSSGAVKNVFKYLSFGQLKKFPAKSRISNEIKI